VAFPARSCAVAVPARSHLGAQSVHRLVDRFGAPFELLETFFVATGTQFFVNAFTDRPASGGNTTLKVIYLSITKLAAIAVQDADGDLLPDNWERFFFGGASFPFRPPARGTTSLGCACADGVPTDGKSLFGTLRPAHRRRPGDGGRNFIGSCLLETRQFPEDEPQIPDDLHG
jgi:hypothetical protein